MPHHFAVAEDGAGGGGDVQKRAEEVQLPVKLLVTAAATAALI